MYTPEATRRAELVIAKHWWSPPFPEETPVAVRVTAYYKRPNDHFLKSGELSAKGKRSSVPMKTPDLDNVVKLVLDALNGVAFRDDRQVQKVEAIRFWATEQGPGVLVQVREVYPGERLGSAP